MRNVTQVLFLFLLSVSLMGQTQLTVYNHGEALVKESFVRQLSKGTSEVELEDVTETIIPSSVKLSGGDDLQVLEQNYRYDLVDQNKLLKKYLGTSVTVITRNDKKMSGELLSYDRETLVISGRNGTDIIQRNHVSNIKCPVPAERLYVRPTLSWRVISNSGGKTGLDLSYMTRQIDWHAEYVAILNEDDTELDLSSWINVNNRSGKNFKEAKLKLVAGSINRAKPRGRSNAEDARVAFMATKSAPVSERGFFEYHLYEIDFPVTIHNLEEKQVQWLRPTVVSTAKRYVYEDRSSEFTNIPIKIEFNNDKQSGTGVALPAGVVRLFKRDTDGALELVGEDNLKHTSKDDLVTFEVGKAFDVKGKFQVLDRRSKQSRYSEEDIRITLANRKDEAVEIDVIQSVGYRNWKILNSEYPHEKLDASRVKFTLQVPANSEKSLTYTTHQSLK